MEEKLAKIALGLIKYQLREKLKEVLCGPKEEIGPATDLLNFLGEINSRGRVSADSAEEIKEGIRVLFNEALDEILRGK